MERAAADDDDDAVEKAGGTESEQLTAGRRGSAARGETHRAAASGATALASMLTAIDALFHTSRQDLDDFFMHVPQRTHTPSSFQPQTHTHDTPATHEYGQLLRLEHTRFTHA